MMMRKLTVAALFILVAAATAHPYAEWSNARYRWNAARGQDVGARVKSQASVELSSCALVTHKLTEMTTDGTEPHDHRVRICPADPEDSPNNVCLVTRVNPCCPSNCSLINLVSGAQVSVAGEVVTVAYYLARRNQAARVCFRLDDAHQGAKTCSQPGREDESCLPPCVHIRGTDNFTFCFNNTLTGNSSSCNGDMCRCKEDYLPPDCCKRKLCRNNCRTGLINDEDGQLINCTTCFNGYKPPTCCNCSSDRVEVDERICKCRANLRPDGTCAEGALEPDCCKCDTTGNATHAFYKNEDDRCIPFCQSNCAAIGVRGCLSCNTGFEAVPECCRCEPGREEVNGICKCSANLRPDGSCRREAKPEDCCECITGYQRNPTTGRCEPDCDQPHLFFFIDATYSNTFENFCPLIVVLQMIVAAFSPSPSSGIQIGSLLFSDNARRRGPSQVFETDTSCFNAVQGKGRSLLSLMKEFGKCLDNHRKYDSYMFPSMCGEGTSAVLGLKEIRNIVRTKSAHKSTVLMITDGIIGDDKEERTKVLSELESAGVTIIEAGYGDADLSTMKLYTDRDNIMIDDDPVELGKAIVNKLKVKGTLCDKYAKNIIESLERFQVNDLSLFCRCHRMKYINHPLCRNKKYPVCGGDLSVGVSPTGMSETLGFQESDLEEEILAAIENVLERFNGHRNY